MAVASVGVKLRGKVLRQSGFHPAVAGMNEPSIVHLRARPHREVNVSIAGAQVNVGERAVNGHVSVAGMGVQPSGEVAHLNVAVAGIDAGLPGDAIDCDVAVARVQVQSGFRGNLHLDAHSSMRADVDAPTTTRHVDLQVDLVAILVPGDAHAAASDVEALANHTCGDGAAGSPRDLNRGIVGIHTQAGLVANLVSLGPFLGEGGNTEDRKA